MRLKTKITDSSVNWREVGSQVKGYIALAVVIVPVLIFSAYQTRNYLSFIASLSAISFLVMVWQLANRATIAGLLAAVICLSFAVSVRFGRKRQVIAAACFSGFSIAGVSWWLHTTRDAARFKIPAGDYFLPTWLIDYERQTIWSHAWGIAFQTPWFGRGANTITCPRGRSSDTRKPGVTCYPLASSQLAPRVIC